VRRVVEFYKLQATNDKRQDLFVVHDDLDIKLGEYKIGFGVGPKVHNGVNSIRTMAGNDFWHVRVGVDNRATSDRLQATGQDYVLDRFTAEEKMIINDVIQKVVDELISRHL
jgi:peptidyl-tRNA hydrolase, PTH1 family